MDSMEVRVARYRLVRRGVRGLRRMIPVWLIVFLCASFASEHDRVVRVCVMWALMFNFVAVSVLMRWMGRWRCPRCGQALHGGWTIASLDGGCYCCGFVP